MMSRNSNTQRASTLIDPATLLTRPTSTSQNMGTSQHHSSSAGGNRHGSDKRKTLLDFEGEKLPEKRPGLATGSSVFGVDTLWEREMLKLKAMEANERADLEEKERQEGLKEAREDHVRRSVLLGASPANLPLNLEQGPATPHIPATPPMLPELSRESSKKRPPIIGDDEEESEEETDTDVKHRVQTAGWNAGSSSEDEGPKRTTGVGLRRKITTKKRANPPGNNNNGEDSEEDLPLAATIGKAKQRATHLPALNDSDDESKPLSMLKPNRFQSSSFNKAAAADDDDDEQPLGLRASRMPTGSMSMYGLGGGAPPASGIPEDEDERPLALHPVGRFSTPRS